MLNVNFSDIPCVFFKPNKAIFKKSFSLFVFSTALTLTGCLSTAPSLGGGSGNTVTGGAAGANSSNENSVIEKCNEPLGTLALFEDRSLPWWGDYRSRYPKLGSTEPVIRTMIQQSNCFVIVERGAAMQAMNRERQLAQAGQLRAGSNIGGGQMVTADYTVSPSIQFSANDTGGLKAIAGGLLGSLGSVVGGGLSKNEAATTLLMIDNRSGVQVSSSVGSAANYDFDLFGGFFAGFLGGAKGYSNTPEGKIITAAFADSYNQMVMALRNYKPQKIRGGLGNGGQLKVDGAPQANINADIVPALVQQAPVSAVVVNNTAGPSTLRTNTNFNARIDAYDEDAMQDYYDSLKQAAESMNAFTQYTDFSSTPEKKNQYIQSMRMMVNLFTNQIEGAAIELSAWPQAAKTESWKVLGSRIERYSTMFNKNRDKIVNNENIDTEIANLYKSINLLTKEDFLN